MVLEAPWFYLVGREVMDNKERGVVPMSGVVVSYIPYGLPFEIQMMLPSGSSS